MGTAKLVVRRAGTRRTAAGSVLRHDGLVERRTQPLLLEGIGAHIPIHATHTHTSISATGAFPCNP